MKREGVNTYFVMAAGRGGGSLLFLTFLRREMGLCERGQQSHGLPFLIPLLPPPPFLLHLLSTNYTAVIALLDPLHV